MLKLGITSFGYEFACKTKGLRLNPYHDSVRSEVENNFDAEIEA
jgi:hypothetical protein